MRGTLQKRIPLWLRRGHRRGGLSFIESAVSFLIMTISAVGAVQTFVAGRVGLENQYEYKMAAEKLRERTEWIIGMVHQVPPSDDKWPANFDNGDLIGHQVVVDRRGKGQNGAGIGNNRDIRGTIYYEPVRAEDILETANTNPDYYSVHTWIVFERPMRSSWLNGMAEQPVSRRDTIDFRARVVPAWIDNR